MGSSGCERFQEELRHYFSYLFREYGFDVIHTESHKGGELCLVVLDSQHCRIAFYRAQGEVNALFGPRTAPVGWSDIHQPGTPWYYLYGLLDFLEGRPFDLRRLFEDMDRHLDYAAQMQGLSERLRPLVGRVISLFEGEHAMSWKVEYEEFKRQRDEEVRKQVSQYARERSNTE